MVVPNVITAAMTNEGNVFGAKLYNAWLSGAGAVALTKPETNQLERDSFPLFDQMIIDHLSSKRTDKTKCPASMTIDFASKNLGGTSPRAHFDYIGVYWGRPNRDRSNVNLFLAIGGAAHKVLGKATLVRKPW